MVRVLYLATLFFGSKMYPSTRARNPGLGCRSASRRRTRRSRQSRRQMRTPLPADDGCSVWGPMHACGRVSVHPVRPAVLTRLAQADSFSWDNIAPPQGKPHPYDVNGWPELERRKSMFEGNDGARRRLERAAVWWARLALMRALSDVSMYVPRTCRVSPCSCAGQDSKTVCRKMSVGSVCKRRTGRLCAPVAGDRGAAAARVDACGAVERLPRLGWFRRGMHSMRARCLHP